MLCTTQFSYSQVYSKFRVHNPVFLVAKYYHKSCSYIQLYIAVMLCSHACMVFYCSGCSQIDMKGLSQLQGIFPCLLIMTKSLNAGYAFIELPYMVRLVTVTVTSKSRCIGYF